MGMRGLHSRPLPRIVGRGGWPWCLDWEPGLVSFSDTTSERMLFAFPHVQASNYVTLSV